MSTYVLDHTVVTRSMAQPTAQSTVRSTVRSTPPARLRLTRRGRVVVRVGVVLLGALVATAVVLGGGRVAHAGEASTPVPVAYHVVQPGESLWQIAGQVAPGVDRRETVARIVDLNALESGSIDAGRRIAVPAAH